MKILLFIILFTVSTAYASESSEITVRLATDNQLVPISLDLIDDRDSGFSASYLKQLEKVLRFDLDHNGFTKVMSKSASLPTVSPSIHHQKLSLIVRSSKGSQEKAIENIALSGTLSQDRRQIHQVADAIQNALFGTKGIATTRFLYTIKNDNIAEVWEADYDGGNACQLTFDEALSVTPTYIPAKEGLKSGNFLYVSYKNGQPKIFLSSLKNKNTQRLSLLKGNQLMPAISRQRDKIAFISDFSNNPDLFLLSFSPEEGIVGKPRQIYSSPAATPASPTFSPDGRRLAFVSNKDGLARIYVMQIPESSPTSNTTPLLITKRNRECTAPAWSPDGQKLAYSAMTNGTRQIWIYDFNSQEERQLTHGPGHKENATWAPNSLHLLYDATSGQSREIFLINLNQPEANCITSGPGEKRFPSWDPSN